jgi:hypothetical protein
VKHQLEKSKEAFTSREGQPRSLSAVMEDVNAKLQYVSDKQGQMKALMLWAKTSEQEQVCKLMMDNIDKEVKEANKIAEKGFNEESKKKDIIIKELNMIDEKISNKINVNI